MRMSALLIAAAALAAAAHGQPGPASDAPKSKVRIAIEEPPPAKNVNPAPKPGAGKPSPEAAKPAAKAGSKPEAKKKAEDEIGRIAGQEIARTGNRYLGLEVVGGKFKLTFYNEKKKPVPPNVSRAALRWDPKYKLGMERVVLTPSGPHSLSAEKFVRPPYNFKLTIVLLGDGPEAADGADPAGETHVIDFRQSG